MYDIKLLQDSDGFGSKRGVLIYHIKLQSMHIYKSNFASACLCWEDCSIMLECRIMKTTGTLQNILESRYTPLIMYIAQLYHTISI